MKSHTTWLIDKENGLAVTRAQKKAVAQACRFARACGLEGELWVLRGEACGTLALGHLLGALDEQGTPMRVVTSISVGNDKTPPKISHHRVDKFPRQTAKEFGWQPIQRNGKPITLAEATQAWDVGARDKIQAAVDAYEEMRKERRNDKPTGQDCSAFDAPVHKSGDPKAMPRRGPIEGGEWRISDAKCRGLFSGSSDSFFGELHMQGKEGVQFFTEQKVSTSRWFGEDEGSIWSIR